MVQSNWWAVDAVNETCQRKPKQAWPLIQGLLRLATTEGLIQDLGAGPLEDFIRAHGEQYIDKIEALAVRRRRFRKALRVVWIRELNKDLTRRLVALGCQELDNLNKKKKRIAQPTSPGDVATRAAPKK